MRTTHRRAWSAASAAVLAATTVGLAAAGSGSAANAEQSSTTASESIAIAEPTAAKRAAAERNALTALSTHKSAALFSKGTAFRTGEAMLDRSGESHVRMDRTYRGLPVLGGDMVVHTAASGAWKSVSQSLTTPVTVGTSPKLTTAQAKAKALKKARAGKDIKNLRTKGKPGLVVDAVGHAPRLAWAVTTAGKRLDGTPSRLTTYVDAKSGSVLRAEEGIETIDGSGESLYSGTVPLQVTQSGSTYQLKDGTRGGTYTTDVDNAEDSVLCTLLGMGCATGTQVTSTSTSFGDGTNADRSTAAVDAQYGTNETWDYYNQVHGRAGIFGDGSGSYNRVHYGTDYVNAFWDGEKMTYGDGDGTEFGPLVSLDVAGHEMSHGVTEHTAGLTYSGESGGLNEATSDIFGTMVEFFADNPNDPGDYLIGEQFDLAHHQGFRRMDDPASDGSSQSCWTTGTKDLDVHYSSGVGNHFFYLLAEGSGAKTIGGTAHNSPTCDGSTVTGIGRDAADKIWFRALTTYFTSGTTYAQARTATISAATDLYGAGSAEATTVAAAWSAVGVG
jgi:zinc metalloprotease ZmpA